jgi:hypothetical protein
MNWNVHREVPAPVHGTAGKAAITELDYGSQDKGVVHRRLPFDRREGFKSFKVEIDVLTKSARHHTFASTSSSFQHIYRKLLER